eukprot:877840-Amorphochlora_amoeboformis.AAC.1
MYTHKTIHACNYKRWNESWTNAWLDLNCESREIRFVCSLGVGATFRPTPSPTASPSLAVTPKPTPYALSSCHSGDAVACIRMPTDKETESEKTQPEARAFCQSRGTDLVSIHSQAENDAFYDLISSQ